MTFPAQEHPTNPATPRAVKAAEEVSSAAVSFHSGPGGWRASVPSALIIAVVTSLSTIGAVKASSPATSEVDSKTIREIKDRVTDLEQLQRDQLRASNRLADEIGNMRTLGDLELTQIKRDVAALKTR